MDGKGWIKLHRKFEDNFLWTEKRTFSKAEAWIDLLLKANHSGKQLMIKDIILKCDRGETLQSLETLSKRWLWSRSKVKRFLEKLQSVSMIRLKSETVTSRISICNYDTYQTLETVTETQAEHRRNAGGTQADTNKNVRIKELKIDYKYIVDLYNRLCPSLPNVRQLSEKRKSAIKARLKENKEDLKVFEELFKKAEASDFISGRNGKWTACTIDNLIAPDLFNKILEGGHDNKGKVISDKGNRNSDINQARDHSRYRKLAVNYNPEEESA